MTHDFKNELPVIDAGGFALRPLRKSDEGMVGFYASDRRVARMTANIPHPLPPGAAAAFIARVTAKGHTEHVWAMDATASGGEELMGVITLDCLDTRQAEIHYWVAPPFQGQEVASKAVTALVGANPLGLETAFASVFQDNPASAKVLTNAGFQYLGDAESFCVSRDATLSTWTYSRALTG